MDSHHPHPPHLNSGNRKQADETGFIHRLDGEALGAQLCVRRRVSASRAQLHKFNDVSDSSDLVTLSDLLPCNAVDAPDAEQCCLQFEIVQQVSELQLFMHMLVSLSHLVPSDAVPRCRELLCKAGSDDR